MAAYQTFIGVALVVFAVLGFSGIAGAATEFAQIGFFFFLGMNLFEFIFGGLRRD